MQGDVNCKEVTMYKELFKRIVEASQTESLTFFVGAGVSKLSDAPKWSELIDAFSDSLGRDRKSNYSNEEYLSIPQMYYYSIGQDEGKYYDFINDCFGSKKLIPNVIHKMLFDMNPHALITTNFDDLLETAASDKCQGFEVVACDDEISQINGNRFILKVHGDLNHRNIVLKEEDYLNYSENFRLVETLLKSIFATNTVVFIGYGLNDYNIKLILNWTKTLLKEKFNKPIFIYTDDAELSRDELRYHESKGLCVVDYRHCVDDDSKSMTFIDRYRCVLNAINCSSNFSLKEKDEVEAFELLYNLLEPLDKMKALRIQDIKEKLQQKIVIDSPGIIDISFGENILFNRFVAINGLEEEERKKFSSDTIQKYQVIISVLSKAQIRWIRCADHKLQHISDDGFVFADSCCMQFDYAEMKKYASIEYSDYHDNYKKAYYLAKLNRYKESYELFVSVATEAYVAKDYLLHVLAQANRYVVYQAMKSVNKNFMYYNSFDIEGLSGGIISSEQIQHMFERLPVEFQNEYRCFKEIASFNMLYENCYYSIQDGMKLQDSADSYTIEWGVTSADKVISRINQNLHFFLGNGLFMEEFTEFKTTIRSLMLTLVHKYSIQTKKSFDVGVFGESPNEIFFDNIDFYCFVEYFDTKQLNKLLGKYSIKTLDFRNIETIELSVKNLFGYYEEVLGTKQNIEMLSMQNKIKKCLNLLRYMSVSQELVDFVCSFIFKYEFREICIGDKILFLDSQLWKRKMYSAVTRTIIENKLIYYIDKHIDAINNDEKFELFSTHSNLNYPNLIHYIKDDGCFKSRKLAYRITKITKNSHTQFKKQIKWFYYSYLSISQQKSVVKWICEELEKEFSFDDFLFLVNHDVKIEKKTLTALKKHLKNEIELSKKDSPIISYPKNDHMEALNLVGYFCRTGSLKRKDFSSFLNCSPVFDLFYEFERFDFEKFDVTWLLQWQDAMIQILSENKTVRHKIRECIAKEINLAQLKDSDLKRLSAILTKYFC